MAPATPGGHLASDHLAEVVLWQSRDLGQRGDRDGDPAECDGGGVGHQGQGHRLHRLEADAHQHHRADRDRRTEAGERLEQGAEAEGDDDHLHALVVRYCAEHPPQDREVSGLLRHVEDPQRVDDDPHDREQTKRRALGAGVERLPERHPVDRNRHGPRHPKGDQRGPLGRGIIPPGVRGGRTAWLGWSLLRSARNSSESMCPATRSAARCTEARPRLLRPPARSATATSSCAVPGRSGLPWLYGFHNEAVRVRENDPSVTVLNGPPARRSPAKMRLLSRHQRRRTPIFASTSRNVVGAISAFLAED